MLSEKSKTLTISKEAHNLCRSQSFYTQTAPKNFDVKSISLSQLGSVQGRFSMAAWRLLSLQRLAFKIGPSLYLGGWQVKPIQNFTWMISGSLCTNYLHKNCSYQTPPFPLGESGILLPARLREPMWPNPKKLWVLSLWYVTTTCNWRNLVHSCVTTERLSSFVSEFPSPTFTFAYFPLYPFRCKLFYIAIATHGCRTGDWKFLTRVGNVCKESCGKYFRYCPPHSLCS